MDNFSINDRVSIKGKDTQGTVAFIGETWFAKGKWIGIILDKPYGKNNGSYGGVRYFLCPKDHGIFVRPGQVQKVVQYPIADTNPKKPSGSDCLTGEPTRVVSNKDGCFNKNESSKELLAAENNAENSSMRIRQKNFGDSNASASSTEADDAPMNATLMELERVHSITNAKLSEIKSYIHDFDEKLQRVILENKGQNFEPESDE